MNRLYQISHTFRLSIVLILPLLLHFAACQKSAKPDHHPELKNWIDSLDRESRKIGSKKAITILDSVMAKLHRKTIGDSIAYYKFMKVLSHRDSTLERNALIYTDSLLRLFTSPQIREEHAAEYSKALLLKGDDLLHQKQTYLAYRNYYKGKTFLLSIGEICECARYSSRIANIAYKEEDYYQAIEYWKQELTELAECKQPDNFQLEFIEKQGSMRNIGTAYLRLDKPHLALKYFKQAKDFINKNTPEFPKEKKFIKFAHLVILRNQAEAYVQKGNSVIAEKLIRKCLEHDTEIEWSIEVEQESRQLLTQLYIDTKQYAKAQEQLNILKKLPAATAHIATISLYQKLQASIFFGVGKFEEAGKLLLANLEIDRNIKLKKNEENKGNVGQLVQQIQREHELELEAEKDARQSLILKFAILLSITLCIIIYLIWRIARKNLQNFRAVSKLNQAITQSNIVLQDTVNALEQTEIENENVLRIVAHDLRSPIASMISASHMIFWEQIPNDDQLEIITAMQDSGEKANKLIGQILQAGPDRDKINKSDAALEEIVQSCIDMLSYKASEKEQKIEYHFEPATLPVDREKIWRVFCNLLSNAIKFSQPGGTISVNLKKENNKVQFSVKDNGIGIPENMKHEIFLPDNNARRSGTAGEQSYGIGLFICKRIVEKHGGRIWFESVKNSGSTFYIELAY